VVSRVRPPVVVGLGSGVGASTVAAALHALDGTDRDGSADVVVCADGGASLLRAEALVTAGSGPRPVLGIVQDRDAPGPARVRLRALESRFGTVVLLPHVERWRDLTHPPEEATALLGQQAEHLPRPLRSYAALCATRPPRCCAPGSSNARRRRRSSYR
jgi:2-polyprenyl-6-methoxyphenol hydroxylase-like FAD-dependent oxidoreductase